MPSRLHLIPLICALFVLSTTVTHAQDADTENTRFIYYEAEAPNQMGWFLLINNLCLEAVMRLNPDLVFDQIEYGTLLRIPKDEPCYTGVLSMSWTEGNPQRLKYYENGQWLAQPYYADAVYTSAESVEEIVARFNVCVEDLLAENILLEDFEFFQRFSLRTLDIFIPRDAPPCYADPPVEIDPPIAETVFLVRDASPPYFSQQLNICAESIPALFWSNYFYQTLAPNSQISITLPIDAPPCYNEAGQRLRFYDDLGYLLDEPVYTDLEVYIAQAGETLETIAQLKRVCLLDLLRVNYFPQLPAAVPIELFIPPRRACPSDLEARLLGRFRGLSSFAYDVNICPQVLAPLNPHITYGTSQAAPRLYRTNSEMYIILPTDATDCYELYTSEIPLSIFEVERILNVCHEEFSFTVRNSFYLYNSNYKIYAPYAAPPCYNEAGQRLIYPPDFSPDQRDTLRYSDLQIHHFEASDTVYSISQHYNVCVRDLLAVNPLIREKRVRAYPVIIPDTRPCYDEETRLPLIYEDENGDPLPTPQVAEQLMYYGSQPIGRMSSYYNVCVNRIEDANRAKLDSEVAYLGWIIPTDRPPCYDNTGMPIYYVCYNQPIDLTRDYTAADAPPISFDADGTHCYDLQAPQTVVWYQNQRYEIIEYQPIYEQFLLSYPAFMAWCFGVPFDELIYVNESFGLLNLDHLRLRVIPPRTRECYMTNPTVLEGHQTIGVGYYQTLSTIVQNFPYTVEDFAAANDIDPPYLIYTGQQLIVPSGISQSALRALAVASITLMLFFIYLRRRLKRSITQP